VGDPDELILREDLSGRVEDPKELVGELAEVRRLMTVHHGAGLAAPQAGLRRNFFVMARKTWAGIPKKQIPIGMNFINPEWRPASDLMMGDFEGCLSLPGKQVRVVRYNSIYVMWTTINGDRIGRTLHGFTARCFQHEADHLKGRMIDELRTIGSV